jgi:uncharacterized protein DUF6328
MRRDAISSALKGGSRSMPASRGSPRPSVRRDSTYADDDCQVESLKDQAHTTHEEARMVLPGIQALFGFQLIAVFNRQFIDLDVFDRGMYLASLVLVAVAIGLIMAPAAYHRLVERDRVSRRWLRLASRDIAWAMVALTPAIAIDVYLVAVMSTGTAVLGVALGSAVAAFLAWLWFAMPLLRRHREHVQREHSRSSGTLGVG